MYRIPPILALTAGHRRKNKLKQNLTPNMKKTLIPILCTILASAAIAADVETTTTTTTTTGDGTITEYSPGKTFIVKESAGPVTYRYGKTVTYVTRSGRTLSDEDVRTRIKVGLPVRVHYITEGGNRVVSRVEVDD